jgi:hypothetical protein
MFDVMPKRKSEHFSIYDMMSGTLLHGPDFTTMMKKYQAYGIRNEMSNETWKF